MSIVEYRGGPITHRYLMKKSKRELKDMYAFNQRAGFGGDVEAATLVLKHKESMASEIMKQVRRMPADE